MFMHFWKSGWKRVLLYGKFLFEMVEISVFLSLCWEPGIVSGLSLRFKYVRKKRRIEQSHVFILVSITGLIEANVEAFSVVC